MEKHVHAENIIQYGQDAQTTAKPWLLWECKTKGKNKWGQCTDGDMHFSAHCDYRRKPKMLSVTLANGEVVSWPEPFKGELDNGDFYYTVATKSGAMRMQWGVIENDDGRLLMGVIHLNKDAAEQHSEALRKINNQGLEP